MKFVPEENAKGTTIAPGTFDAYIKIDMSIDEPTEIYANLNITSPWTWYPNDVDIAIDIPAGGHVLDIEDNSIFIRVTDQQFDGKVMNVVLTPKQASNNDTTNEEFKAFIQ